MAGFAGTPATPFTLPARNGPIIRHFISEYAEGGPSWANEIPVISICAVSRSARQAVLRRPFFGSIRFLAFARSSFLMVRHLHRSRLKAPELAVCLLPLPITQLFLAVCSTPGCPALSRFSKETAGTRARF